MHTVVLIMLRLIYFLQYLLSITLWNIFGLQYVHYHISPSTKFLRHLLYALP